MAERIPRRLKRFYRGKGEQPVSAAQANAGKAASEITESLYGQLSEAEPKRQDKEKAIEIALKEVQSFKEKHNRLPQREEYNKMIENIYEQLKGKQEASESARRKRVSGEKRAKERVRKTAAQRREERLARKKRGKRHEKDASIESRPPVPRLDESDVRNLSVEDLFKGEAAPQKGSLSLEDEFGLGDLAKDLGISGEGKDKCPNCKKPAAKIIYCDECGAAFCAKCSKSIEESKGKRVVCPKCGKLLDA